MKRKLILMLLLTTNSTFSCDDQGAFGFEFGNPVPSDAEQFQYEGGSARNAAGCFYGTLPEQLIGWEKYSYCANRDRKFVYALRASSKVEPPAYPIPSERSAKSANVVPTVVVATMRTE